MFSENLSRRSAFANSSNNTCFVKFWLRLCLEALKQHLTELPEQSEKVGENFLFGDLKPFPGAAGQFSSLQLASFCFPLYQPGVDSSLTVFFSVFFTPVKTIIFTTHFFFSPKLAYFPSFVEEVWNITACFLMLHLCAKSTRCANVGLYRVVVVGCRRNWLGCSSPALVQ